MILDAHEGPSVFRSGKIFFQSTISGDVSGWYIAMQTGNVYGPFREKDVARSILQGLATRKARRHHGLAQSA